MPADGTTQWSAQRAAPLEGRCVIVTGAARGLGRATAAALADAGADLVLLDVASDLPGVGYPLGTADQLDHTAELARKAGAGVLTVQADVRDAAAVEAAVEVAIARFGRVDGLVNSAGIVAPSGKIAHEITEAEWQLMIDVDLHGSWRMVRAVAPHLVRQRSGSIVNVSSTAGLVGYRHFAGYVTAKHALVGLTKACALDYAPYGVRVNALCPGSIRDDPALDGRMLAEVARCLDVPLAGHEQLFTESQPTNRLVEAAEVAAAALWLLSEGSRHVTGTALPVDGGFTIR
jgi:NAD(P)-dependent dehydrogenase (short-subunit alcohol dehydrogenase family)